MIGTYGHCGVRIFKRGKPFMTQDIRLYWSSPGTRDNYTYCRAFGSGTVTTCCNDLRLSRLKFEQLPLAERKLFPTATPPRR